MLPTIGNGVLAGSEACGAGAAAGLTLLRAGVRCFGLFATPELGWLLAADGLLTGIADGGYEVAAALGAVCVPLAGMAGYSYVRGKAVEKGPIP